MKITLWTVSTCSPGSPDPKAVQVFGTEIEARAWFRDRMKEEWALRGAQDPATGRTLPFPANAEEAHHHMAQDEAWGRWNLDKHEVAIPTPLVLEALRLTTPPTDH